MIIDQQIARKKDGERQVKENQELMQKQKEQKAVLDELKKATAGKTLSYDSKGQVLIVNLPNLVKTKPGFGLLS